MKKYAEFLKILGVLFLKYGVFLVKTRCEFSDKSQKNNPLAPNDRLLCYKLFKKLQGEIYVKRNRILQYTVELLRN